MNYARRTAAKAPQACDAPVSIDFVDETGNRMGCDLAVGSKVADLIRFVQPHFSKPIQVALRESEGRWRLQAADILVQAGNVYSFKFGTPTACVPHEAAAAPPSRTSALMRRAMPYTAAPFKLGGPTTGSAPPPRGPIRDYADLVYMFERVRWPRDLNSLTISNVHPNTIKSIIGVRVGKTKCRLPYEVLVLTATEEESYDVSLVKKTLVPAGTVLDLLQEQAPLLAGRKSPASAKKIDAILNNLLEVHHKRYLKAMVYWKADGQVVVCSPPVSMTKAGNDDDATGESDAQDIAVQQSTTRTRRATKKDGQKPRTSAKAARGAFDDPSSSSSANGSVTTTSDRDAVRVSGSRTTSRLSRRKDTGVPTTSTGAARRPSSPDPDGASSASGSPSDDDSTGEANTPASSSASEPRLSRTSLPKDVAPASTSKTTPTATATTAHADEGMDAATLQAVFDALEEFGDDTCPTKNTVATSGITVVEDGGGHKTIVPYSYLYDIEVSRVCFALEATLGVAWGSSLLELGMMLASQLNPKVSYAAWAAETNDPEDIAVPVVNQHVFVVSGEDHWSLAVVDASANTITHYNSVKPLHKEKVVRSQAKGFGLNVDDKKYIVKKDMPQQLGDNNCGPATVGAVLKLAVGLSVRAELREFQRTLLDKYPCHPMAAERMYNNRPAGHCPWSQWRRYIPKFLSKQPTQPVPSRHYTPIAPWTAVA